jgi:hypothetical protein
LRSGGRTLRRRRDRSSAKHTPGCIPAGAKAHAAR